MRDLCACGLDTFGKGQIKRLRDWKKGKGGEELSSQSARMSRCPHRIPDQEAVEADEM